MFIIFPASAMSRHQSRSADSREKGNVLARPAHTAFRIRLFLHFQNRQRGCGLQKSQIKSDQSKGASPRNRTYGTLSESKIVVDKRLETDDLGALLQVEE